MTSSVTRGQTLYGILGVQADASPADIRAAYREALLAMHPDKRASGTSAADADAFLRLHSAWQVHIAYLRSLIWKRKSLHSTVDCARQKAAIVNYGWRYCTRV